MATDPVCFMIIDEENAPFRSNVQGYRILLLL